MSTLRHTQSSMSPAQIASKRTTLKANSVIYWFGVILLIAVVVVYKYKIVRPVYDNYTIENTYIHIANIHDHLEYEAALLDLNHLLNADSNHFDNVTGIASFYLLLSIIFGIDNFITVSLLVNCIALVISVMIFFFSDGGILSFLS